MSSKVQILKVSWIFIFKKANVRSIYIYSWYFLEGCQYSILWNFVTRIMNWNLCSSFFLWAYCVHWMHYKDEKHHTEYFYESHPCKRAPIQTVNYKRSMSCSPHYNPKKGNDRNLFPNDERVDTLCDW